LECAKQVLSNLEESEFTAKGSVRPPRRAQDREKIKKPRAGAADGFIWPARV
jgi:hypothetical protein